MNKVVLQRKTKQGLLIATYSPDQGMNLTSLKLGSYEIIDQNTRSLFNERNSGLGPLIGPHFYHRNKDQIPELPNKNIFKHTAKKEYPEPLSHGIGRYVPWNYEASDMSLRANLSGIDSYKGYSLASLEGFDFKLDYQVHLTENGLKIQYNAESPTHPTIVGLHYYYRCDPNAHVQIDSDTTYGDMGKLKPLKKSWITPEISGVDFPLSEQSDYTFRKESKKNEASATLKNNDYNLSIHYKSKNDEHAFQLYHPNNESFVCIEPVSAKNPRDAKLLKNSLSVEIKIDLLKQNISEIAS